MPSKPYRIQSPRSVATAVRHYRRKAGMTQQRLAELAGVERKFISRLEAGYDSEHLARLLRILRELGVSVALDEDQHRG